MIDQTLIKKIENRMKELVPEISLVSATPIIDISIYINDEKIRNKVYEAEMKIMDEFSMNSFDFHVINKEVQ